MTHVILSESWSGFPVHLTPQLTTEGFADFDGESWYPNNKEKGSPPIFNANTVSNVRGVTKAKVLAAFGGWAQDEEYHLAAESGSMEKLAKGIIDFVDKYDL